MEKKYVKTMVVLLMAAVLLFAVTTVAFAAGDEETASNAPAIITLTILGIAAVLFMTEIIPLAVTSMCIPIALALTGVVSANSAFSGLSNTNVILFAGMFVVGGALFETGVAKIIGDFVVKLSKGSEKTMVLGVMIFTAFMSSVLSNTGTVAVMLPVCIGIADAAGFPRGRLLMPLAMMASIGGMISLVGTPPNNTVNIVISEAGYRSFGFFEYAWIGLPLTVVSIIFIMTLGWGLLPKVSEDVDDTHMPNTFLTNKKQSLRKQIVSTAILLVCVVVMATEIMPLHIAAVAGAMLAVITGCISEKEAYNSIDWTTIFLFAGTLSLANAMDSTGAGRVIADAIIGLVGDSTSPYVLMTACFVLSAGLTQLMTPLLGGKSTIIFLITVVTLPTILTNFGSNVVVGVIFIPIAYNFANAAGLNHTAIACMLVLCTTCALATPAGCATAAILHGNKEWITSTQATKYGVIFLILIVIITLLIGYPLGCVLF